MRVRPATRADLPAITNIYNDAVLTTTATYDYEPRTSDAQARWFEEHERESYPVFVAVDDVERVVGWSSLSAYHRRPGYRFTAEDSVYVAEDERGKGVGTLLIPPLIEAAQQLRLRAIIASIDASSEASLRLHRRFGFEQVGHFRQVGYKFDRWLDVIYLERLLA
ncbi:MAG: N-acetyltransferase [Chloroflexota bacterium]|nr:N-acetyltransferase [Chloroflexota bacterium]